VAFTRSPNPGTFARTRSRSAHRSFGSRRLRQRWRWLPNGLRVQLAGLRSWFAHRRVFRRVLFVGAVVLFGAVLFGVTARAREVQSRWGSTVEVLVAKADVAVGERVDSGHLALEVRPVAFLPADVLYEPIDREEHAVRALVSGDVVTARDLRSTRPALDLRADQRAVSVPIDATVQALAVGDEADLFVMTETFGATLEQDVKRLESVAVVLDVNDSAVTFAVNAVDVTLLARAVSNGRVVIALRSTDPIE
jgi:Flp pilus assembly protein CpaB